MCGVASLSSLSRARIMRHPTCMAVLACDMRLLPPALPRVRKGVQRIRESKGKAAQGRLESFFGPVTVTKKAAKEGEGKGKKGAG